MQKQLSFQTRSSYFPLYAACLWTLYFALIHLLLLKVPLLPLVFLRFVFMASIDFVSSVPKNSTKNLKTSQLSLHFITHISSIACIYCLYGALSQLPLTNVMTLYLAFPAFVPWILRIWIGKKIHKGLIAASLLVFIGAVFTFNKSFEYNNLLVFLGLSAGALKALHWVAHRRLKSSESPFRLWFYQSLICLSISGILLTYSWPPFKFPYYLLILGTVLIEFATQLLLNQGSDKTTTLLQKGILFNLAIFIAPLIDLIFFHTVSPWKPFLCSFLVYFGLVFLFSQKNDLPNPLYDL